MIRWKKKEEIKKELEEIKKFQIRQERNKLIARTDFFMLPDYPLSEKEKTEIITYRKALRDMTESSENPENWNLPKKPDFVK